MISNGCIVKAKTDFIFYPEYYRLSVRYNNMSKLDLVSILWKKKINKMYYETLTQY